MTNEESGETASEDKKETPDNSEKYCKNCGEIIHKDAEICPECGVRVKEKDNQNINVNVDNQNQVSNTNQNIQSGTEQPQGSKSRIVAALLAFFFGWIGGHKFYLGQPGRGLLYLVFFWTYIPFLISIIQGIAYLLMSDQKFAARFG